MGIQSRLNFARSIAREGGALAARAFRHPEDLTVELKGGRHDPVSDADRAVESLIRRRIADLDRRLAVEAADLVVAGKHRELAQDESQATYEGWFREGEARINWANHADVVYNLIRACNPAPGAWTMLNGKKVQIFDAKKHLFRRFADVAGKMGEVSAVNDKSFRITAQGGTIEVLRARGEDGKKISGGDFAKANGIANGMVFDA